MSYQSSKLNWFNPINYEFLKDCNSKTICNMVNYRIEFNNYLKSVKDIDFSKHIDNAYARSFHKKRVKEFFVGIMNPSELKKNRLEDFNNTAVDNISFHDVQYHLSIPANTAKILRKVRLSKIGHMLRGTSLQVELDKAKQLAKSMSWKEHDYLDGKPNVIPHMYDLPPDSAEDSVKDIHNFFKNTKVDCHLIDEHHLNTFIKVNLLAPTQQIEEELINLVNKIRKERFRENFFDVELPTQMGLTDGRGGAKKYIKSFIEHRVLPYMDLLIWCKYNNIDLEDEEILDQLFKDDNRTLSVTKLRNSTRGMYEKFSDPIWLEGFSFFDVPSYNELFKQ